MIPNTDWSRIYYAVVMVYNSRGNDFYKILGLGKSISSAKIDAMFYYDQTRKNERIDVLTDLNIINDLILGERRRLAHRSAYVVIMYAEAKIYEYAKEWNREYFDVILDPSVKENLLRFVRYRRTAHWADVYHYSKEKALNTDKQS